MTSVTGTDKPVQIGPLRVEEDEAAAAVVAQAFRNEGFMRSALKLDTPQRRERLARMARVQLRTYHYAGHQLVAARQSGELAGVAVVQLPRPTPILPWYRRVALIASQLPRVAPMLLDVNWRQVARIALKIKAPSALPKPYYTLQIIGVTPDFQGQGIGGRLLAYIHARADEEDPQATGIYLYTGDEPNTGFYARYGYEVVEVRKAGPLTMWFMFRPRATPAGAGAA